MSGVRCPVSGVQLFWVLECEVGPVGFRGSRHSAAAFIAAKRLSSARSAILARSRRSRERTFIAAKRLPPTEGHSTPRRRRGLSSPQSGSHRPEGPFSPDPDAVGRGLSSPQSGSPRPEGPFSPEPYASSSSAASSIILSCTCRGTASYAKNSDLWSPLPCVSDLRAVEYR